VALRVERRVLGLDALDAMAREHRLHLVLYLAQGSGGDTAELQPAVDAVDDLEPVQQQPVARLEGTAVDLLLGALAVVLEVGARAEPAVAQALDLGRRRRRPLVSHG
jgi:hypothetical protein